MREYPGGVTLKSLLEKSIEEHGDSAAFGFAGEKPMSYSDVGRSVESLIAMMQSTGTSQGDRVAILSSNMPNWPVAYFAIVSMGAVVVPILPDFSASEVKNIIEHSGARLVFVSHALSHKCKGLPEGITIVPLDDLPEVTPPAHGRGERPTEAITVGENDLAAIIYTSGTTGKSKGVMLTHRNICFTAYGGSLIQPLTNEDRFLSVLPLSHTYENTLGLILAVMHASSIWYLRKPPTAPVLLPALSEVKPTVMLTVPLIIEKIYFNKILPTMNSKAITRLLFTFPPARKLLSRVAGRKLLRTFGGELKFFGIGGAKVNRIVERFLIESRFPYAIGYGLTETSPLLAGFGPFRGKWESTGPAMNGVTLKINDPDPTTGRGEIWAKGANVMKGYYKQSDLTAEVITEDGWFKTGDLGAIDESGYLFIKGRSKNMILTSTGENIYPEEIESVINTFSHVVDSLVVEKSGRLVAMVHLNLDEIESMYRDMKENMSQRLDDLINETLNELQEYVNQQVGKGRQLSAVELHREPFQKTPTMKIKRFLYH